MITIGEEDTQDSNENPNPWDSEVGGYFVYSFRRKGELIHTNVGVIKKYSVEKQCFKATLSNRVKRFAETRFSRNVILASEK